MSESLVVGVECNASTATAVVLTQAGDLIGQATGRGARMIQEGAAQTVECITTVVRESLAVAGVTSEVPAVLCAGVAGVGRDQERFVLWRELFKLELAREVVVQPDATVAIYDAFGGAPGVLIIGGVGAIAYGQDAEARPVRCGGWGPLVGDEGGGAWIGRQTLALVTAMADGREPRSALLEAVLATMGVKAPADVIPWAASASPTKLATLAAPLFDRARAGDAGAVALVDAAARELVRLVVALAPVIAPTGTPQVACAGSFLEKASPLRAAFAAELARRVPGAELHATEVVPARGAADLALLYLGDRSAASKFGQVAALARA